MMHVCCSEMSECIERYYAHGWAEILELYTGTREEYDAKQLQNTL